MATIPASQIVSVTPSVLSAGGSALALNGLILTQNTRVPVGAVLSFPNDGTSVASFFGASAAEVDIADIYFNGFDTSTKKPSNILFTQYNSKSVSAWLRGGSVSSLTLVQLQALSGSLTIPVDGVPRVAASIDLSAASSFSAAAALIQSGLNGSPATVASFTADIAAATASATGSISGYVLTVSVVGSGELVPGAILSGSGVTANTEITSQLTGTPGGAGTYAVSLSQTVSSVALTADYGLMTVSAVASGTISVGQELAGSGVTLDTQVTGLGTGSGLTGTYYVQSNTVVTSTAITATGVDVAVSYDSVSGGFVVTSGIVGAPSSIGYATGTLSAGVALTQATGATLSQGADAAQPGTFMQAVSQTTQNWATFMHMFDPDNGVGNTQKLLFAAWNNTTNKRFAYVVRDTDITPTESDSATTSLGYIAQTLGYNGIAPIYDPTSQGLDAFICGTAASIDVEATNGRITFAFRGQSGLVATVTDATSASNLIANGYNFYGAYATAAQQFVELQPGLVSGQFEWLDSYLNQILLNASLQLAWMELLQAVNSVPYNSQGYGLIKAAALDPINAALNFGSIRPGVTLSLAQASQINNAGGSANAVQVQGWYLLIQDATPQVRAARGTPPMIFWYADGGSVQKLDLASILVQ